MNNMPQPFWAVILAVLGVALAIVIYVVPGDQTSKQTAFNIAAALVTGSLGAFAGHAQASSTNKVNASTATINTAPAEPQQ